MKKQNFIARALETITLPFSSLSILTDESMHFNEDGSWDKHIERKNRKLERKANRVARRAAISSNRLPVFNAPSFLDYSAGNADRMIIAE